MLELFLDIEVPAKLDIQVPDIRVLGLPDPKDEVQVILRLVWVEESVCMSGSAGASCGRALKGYAWGPFTRNETEDITSAKYSILEFKHNTNPNVH